MLRLFKTVSRNKLFYVFALLIVLMFPSTIYLQSDKDLTIIITAIGIDKQDDNIKLSTLAVIPEGGSDISSNLEVFEGNGKTVSEAFSKISNSTGKKIGLAHCDCIVMSLDAMDENLTQYLDYFIRTSNLTTNASLIATDNTASDLLEATKSSNNLLDLSLKNIVQFKEERSLLDSVNIEKFYKQYFSESSTFYMPLLSVDKKPSGDKASGQGSSQGDGVEAGSGGGAGEGEKKISDTNKIAVLSKGKFVRTLDDDEYFIYSLINKNTKGFTITLDNVNDSAITNSTCVFEQISKVVFPKYSFDNDMPTATYDIILNLRIEEVSGENFSYSAVDGLHNFLDNGTKSKLENMVKEKLSSTLTKLKADKIDILNLYSKFNAYHHSKWENYLSRLEFSSDYLDDIDIKINLKLFNVL